MEQQKQINNLDNEEVINYLLNKKSEIFLSSKYINNDEKIKSILDNLNSKDIECLINRIKEENFIWLVDHIDSVHIKNEILKYLWSSNIISPIKYKEFENEVSLVICISIKELLKKKFWIEIYEKVINSFEWWNNELDTENIKDSKNEKWNDLTTILNSIIKIITLWKWLFNNENNRLKYVIYVFIFFTFSFIISWTVFVLNKHPDIITEKWKKNITETKNYSWSNQNINNYEKSTINNDNSNTVNNSSITNNNISNNTTNIIYETNKEKLTLIEKKIEKIMSYLSISNAYADNSIINQKTNELFDLKKESNSVDLASLNNVQKIQIQNINKNIDNGFKKLIELWKLKNYPMDDLEEISSVMSNELWKLQFLTVYPYKNLWFSTHYKNNIWTYIEFINPINKTLLITCNNLVQWVDLNNIEPIYIGKNCNFNDVKYIHPLFVRKPIWNYWLNSDIISSINNLFKTNNSDKTIWCWENKCLYYKPEGVISLNMNDINLNLKIYPFDNFKYTKWKIGKN